ncbi:LamG domain-containing protein, partial [Streptomyces synnematoformans]|uniref:LamG domain-containing protein n=1 Tax=Streptomyces synnematoformans TaxID=415721 RepID=UPI0031D51AAE
DDPWFDGVGRYGTFTLDAPDADVDRYRYGINGDPVPAHQVSTSGGAARQVQILPTRPGLNFVTAESFDAAGNNSSEVRTYMFRVKAGQPERATWQLDEPAGAAQAAGSTPPRSLDLRGGAATGAAGVRGNALALDGVDGHVATGIPVVETTGAHAVSAWVKLDEVPQGNAMVASHPGNSRSSFALFYHAGLQRWVFNHHAADAPGNVTRAMADTPGGVTVGEWTHLVGSYDGHNQRIELFVNGQLAGQADVTGLWDARRGLMLGATTNDGSPAHFLPGALDEVQLFDRRLNPEDVAKLYQHQMVGDDPSRPAVAVFDLDEPAGATRVSGQAEVVPATYQGGVTTGTPGVAGKAAAFNGADGYAQIGHNRGTPFDSRRSYALAAWAKITPGSHQGRKAVVSLLDNQRPVVSLFYAADKDRWAVGGFDADTTDAQLIYAGQPEGAAHQDTWAHIVGVHDAVTQTITLYVNGNRIATADWTNARFADRPLLIAASELSGTTGEYFPGTIDDIRVFDRPISTPEVQQLYKQRPLVKARWKFEEATGTDPVTSPDDSGQADSVTLEGGARLGTGWIDFSGLELDGVDDHAAASVPVDTSGSFTLTGWAQAAAMPGGAVTVASAEGDAANAFSVRYLPDTGTPDAPGSWQIALPSSDAADASVVRVNSAGFYDVRQWNHLALVYDGLAKELKLYVNGVLEETACADDDGDGEPDQAGCEDLVPWAEDALSFRATGELQIGRAGTSAGGFGEYFPGVVDDVWAFQGPLSDDQVAWLAANWFDVPTQVPPGG